jgi:hypothetical protein
MGVRFLIKHILLQVKKLAHVMAGGIAGESDLFSGLDALGHLICRDELNNQGQVHLVVC